MRRALHLRRASRLRRAAAPAGSIAAVSMLAALLCACGGPAPAPEGGAAAEAAGGAAAESSAGAGVELDADGQRRLGIVTAPLEAAEYETRVEGIGVVVAAQSVIERSAALVTAEATLRKSQAALDRARSLYKADTAVSREALEAAESQATADAAALELARSQAAAAFGRGAPWLDAKRRDSILDALSSGRAVVVRASFPAGLPDGVPPRVTLRRVGARESGGDAESWTTTDVWLGPADPAVPGPVLLAYVESGGNGGGLVAGERVAASVAGGKIEAGVLVPGSAVVIAGGAAWCYVLEGEDRFVRVPVSLYRPLGSGYFQAAAGSAARDASAATGAKRDAGAAGASAETEPAAAVLAPGRPVVVAGAGLLLGAETGGGEEED